MIHSKLPQMQSSFGLRRMADIKWVPFAAAQAAWPGMAIWTASQSLMILIVQKIQNLDTMHTNIIKRLENC